MLVNAIFDQESQHNRDAGFSYEIIVRMGVAGDLACLPGCFTRLRACDGHVKALNISGETLLY